MSVTIHLPAEVEESLVAQAHEQGLELPEFVENILREQAKPVAPKRELTPAEKAALWIEGSKRFPHTPPLSDEAISRESMYDTRG